MLRTSPSGPQLKSNKILPRTQTATEPTVPQVSTAKSQHAQEPTDHSMDQSVPHAPTQNQQQSHTITPPQLTEDHTPPPVILPHSTQRHQSQLRSSSNWIQSQPPLQPPLQPRQQPQPRMLKPQLAIRKPLPLPPTHLVQLQRRSPSSTVQARSPRATPPSTANTESVRFSNK